MLLTPAINEKNFKPGCFFRFYCLHPYNYVYLMFTLRCRQADIVATVLSPVSLLPAMNIASVVVTCPVIAGVIVTGD